MAIDPGIYAQAGRPSVELQNPLQIAGQAAQVAAGVNANRLFQAQTARGQAMQQAIDPTTGALDLGKFNRLIAANPAAAQAAPEALGQSTALAGSQQQQNMTRNDFLMRGLGAVSDLSDDQLHSGLAQFAHRAETVAGVDPLEVKSILAALPNDPAQLRTALRQAQMSLQTPEAQQAITYQKPVNVNDGQTLQPMLQASGMHGGGMVPAGPGIQMQLSPGEENAPTDIGITKGGAPIKGTLRQFINKATGGQSPLGTGRIPAGLMNPANAPQAPAGGGIVSGLSPDQTAALAKTGGDSAAAFQGYADDANKAVAQNAILGNMLADSKQFTTGPLNDRIKAFQSFATTYAPKTAGAFGVDPAKVAANESFDKFAAQLANAQGAGSDARLNVNQAANPHGAMAPESVDLVLRQLQGNSDFTKAKAALAHSWSDKTDRTGFEAHVRDNLDPRAFQFARMTVPQRQSYAAALSPQDRDAVKSAYKFAHDNGMINAGQ